MAIYKDDKMTKDGRQYYYMVYKKDFNGVNKKYKSKRYKTKPEAKEAEARFLLKRDNPINKNFSDVAKCFFEELYLIRKESTAFSYENAYNKNIEPYFKNLRLNDITISTINNWKNEILKKDFKLSYLNKLYNVLNHIFVYSMRNFSTENNPVSISGKFQKKNEDVISNKEKVKYITFEQFQTFISCIDDITWKTFFIFLYYTGMRKGEVQALKWTDIDFDKNEIIVNKTLSVKTKSGYKITNTKNYINREITINKTLKENLIIYKNEIKKYSDFNENWFVFGCGRFMPQTTIDRKKHYYFQLSGIKEITIHEFRHSHVSLLINEYLKSGQTDTTKFFLIMSTRMGHSVDVMQDIYMHLFPTVQNEIVDILDNL